MNRVTLILVGLVIILAVLVGILAVRKPVVNNDAKIRYENQIDSLNTVIHGYQDERVKLDSIINNYKYDISILDHKMDSVENYINWLKQDYDEKIDGIRNYNSTELNKFFSDRYPR